MKTQRELLMKNEGITEVLELKQAGQKLKCVKHKLKAKIPKIKAKNLDQQNCKS